MPGCMDAKPIKTAGLHDCETAGSLHENDISPPLAGGEGFVGEQCEPYKDRGGVKTPQQPRNPRQRNPRLQDSRTA